jgi:hypothetical protein
MTARRDDDQVSRRLLDALAESATELSDAEVIAEAREAGEDPEVVAAEMRALAHGAVKLAQQQPRAALASSEHMAAGFEIQPTTLPPDPDDRLHLQETLRGRLSSTPPRRYRRLAGAASVAVAIVVGALIIHFWRGANQPASPTLALDHHKPHAAPKANTAPEDTSGQKVIKEPRSPVPILALALVPGNAARTGRGALEGGQTIAISVHPGQYRLLLTLALGDADAADYQHYEVTVRTMDGNEVTRKSGQLQALPANKPSKILVTMPPSVLRPGEYIVKLSGVAPPTNLEYSFQVQNQ